MPQQTGDYYLAIIYGTLILVLLGVAIVVFIFQYQKKHRKFLEQKKLFAQTLLQAQLEIKEQTLRHIAHELHDNLGQVASLIKINLNTLQLEDRAKSEQKVEDTKELVRQLIADLKFLSISLNSDRVFQMGIFKSIDREVQRMNKTGQFQTTFSHTGPEPSLDANTTLILFRMIQELLNNIVKHSAAINVNILMNCTDKMFTLVCIDNGSGFEVVEKTGCGSGLLNLHNRAKLINAEFTIESALGKGTRSSIELPL